MKKVENKMCMTNISEGRTNGHKGRERRRKAYLEEMT